MVLNVLTYIVKFIPLLLSTLIAFFSIFPTNTAKLEEEITEQVNRISSLEQAYENGEIAPVDEASFFKGNLENELKSGIKFNEMRFLATHNSYQTPATKATKKLYHNLYDLTFGLFPGNEVEFWSETLTNQLNCGIRSFEIDIETFDRDGEISFTCMHSPYFEMATSCYDFSLALKEISMWSNNNPNHLPITVIIEPKGSFIPLKDMKYFNINYAKALDTVLRDCLGDKLFTPADMLGDYKSFGEMRAADDWCEVKDMLGKVLILFHENNTTEKYIEIDPSIKTQAMFPMLREKDIDRDCASFILANKPEELIETSDNIIKERKIIVRTRADKFGSISEKRRELAFASNAQIVSTDYPVRTDLTADSYVVTFGEKTTIIKTS